MSRYGNLFALGPDGLGYILPEDDPTVSYAFSIRNLRDVLAPTFEEAGLREGDAVSFELNEKRQVVRLVPVSDPLESTTPGFVSSL